MTLTRRTLAASIPVLAAWPVSAGEPQQLFADYERTVGGHVGVYAENIRTGRRILWRSDDRFVMCSTFKASLAASVLQRVERGQDRFDALVSYTAADISGYAPVAQKGLAKGELSVLDMCAAAVEWSDNACANLLLARIGGPPAMTAFWRSIGDFTTRLDHNEPMLNRSAPGDPHDTTTPAAMAANLRRLILGDKLSSTSRHLLTGWMLACKTGDNRLRAGLPKAWKIADKTGNNGADAAGDIAIAWPKPDAPVLICVYTQGGSPSPERLTTLFSDIGRLVGERLR